MDEVSIIINGVRYDAVAHTDSMSCDDCDVDNYCDCACSFCDSFNLYKQVFKKSTKSFER